MFHVENPMEQLLNDPNFERWSKQHIFGIPSDQTKDELYELLICETHNHKTLCCKGDIFESVENYYKPNSFYDKCQCGAKIVKYKKYKSQKWDKKPQTVV